MIPRTLVPRGARPPAVDEPSTRRRPTSLDERTLVPATLPLVVLDGHSTIPNTLPLEAIAARVVVPRDLNIEEVQRPDDSSLPAQPTEMDERITVPQGSAPLEVLPGPIQVSEELVQPDIIQTGELSFLPSVEKQKKPIGEMIVAGVSLLLNLFFVIAMVEILAYHSRSHEQEEIGRSQISVLLPPGALESLKPTTVPTPPAPHPAVKVDPRVISRVAPTPNLLLSRLHNLRQNHRRESCLPHRHRSPTQRHRQPNPWMGAKGSFQNRRRLSRSQKCRFLRRG